MALQRSNIAHLHRPWRATSEYAIDATAAVWSLWDFGVRCIIAPSFGDIFAANCLQNGVLAIRLPQSDVGAIGIELEGQAGKQMTVDLIAQKITTPARQTLPFDIEPQQREALIEGLDEIGLTLRLREQVLNHQRVSNMNQPWMYPKHTKAQTTRILFLAGDGVGKEIMAQVRRIEAGDHLLGIEHDSHEILNVSAARKECVKVLIPFEYIVLQLQPITAWILVAKRDRRSVVDGPASKPTTHRRSAQYLL